MIDTIVQQLGADAPSLLEHVVTTIERDSLHLPGPDFVDRVWLDSDRPLPVIRNPGAVRVHGQLLHAVPTAAVLRSERRDAHSDCLSGRELQLLPR